MWSRKWQYLGNTFEIISSFYSVSVYLFAVLYCQMVHTTKVTIIITTTRQRQEQREQQQQRSKFTQLGLALSMRKIKTRAMPNNSRRTLMN